MKKYLSMFAFVAAIVLGAFAFASCSSDDDEENVKHSFSCSVMLNSDNNATRENPEFRHKQQNLNILSQIKMEKFTATDKEAKVIWESIKDKYRDKLMDELEVLTEEFDDNQIYFEIIISRDGLAWDGLICRFKK